MKTTRTRQVAVRFHNTNVFITPTGVRFSSKGRVLDTSTALGTLSKGQARILRKALRASGYAGRAGMPRK